MDTEECYAVTKCAEVILRSDKMVKEEGLDVLEEGLDVLEEGLDVLEERMKALDPEHTEICN